MNDHNLKHFLNAMRSTKGTKIENNIEHSRVIVPIFKQYDPENDYPYQTQYIEALENSIEENLKRLDARYFLQYQKEYNVLKETFEPLGLDYLDDYETRLKSLNNSLKNILFSLEYKNS